MNISLQKVWNESEQKREVKPRDYLYASEIGRAKLDVYLSMLGTPPSNPFDVRVQRIFDAGSAFEWLIKRVMSVAGILLDEEIVMETKATDELLSVHGRADMLIGGTPNVAAVRASKEFELLPEFLKTKMENILRYLEGVREIDPFLTEIKSVNSMAFWAHKNMDEETGYFKGYEHHKMGQCTSYMIASGNETMRLFYVSRDDLCLMETIVKKSDWEDRWLNYVQEMTYHYKNRIEPEREEDVVFNPEKTSKFFPKGKWEKNWNIGRSPYLTRITGMTKEEWEDYTDKIVKEKNKDIKDTKANRSKDAGKDDAETLDEA